uniref:SFRICE_027825 n=1 Tax=Spodoptera frugiperda TaxID=7108 RepID=A0A2H1VE99_SPOFR
MTYKKLSISLKLENGWNDLTNFGLDIFLWKSRAGLKGEKIMFEAVAPAAGGPSVGGKPPLKSYNSVQIDDYIFLCTPLQCLWCSVFRGRALSTLWGHFLEIIAYCGPESKKCNKGYKGEA